MRSDDRGDRGFNAFDLRRQLEEAQEAGAPDTLTIKDVEGNRYLLVNMQGSDAAGNVLVIELDSPGSRHSP